MKAVAGVVMSLATSLHDASEVRAADRRDSPRGAGKSALVSGKEDVRHVRIELVVGGEGMMERLYSVMSRFTPSRSRVHGTFATTSIGGPVSARRLPAPAHTSSTRTWHNRLNGAFATSRGNGPVASGLARTPRRGAEFMRSALPLHTPQGTS